MLVLTCAHWMLVLINLLPLTFRFRLQRYTKTVASTWLVRATLDGMCVCVSVPYSLVVCRGGGGKETQADCLFVFSFLVFCMHCKRCVLAHPPCSACVGLAVDWQTFPTSKGNVAIEGARGKQGGFRLLAQRIFSLGNPVFPLLLIFV